MHLHSLGVCKCLNITVSILLVSFRIVSRYGFQWATKIMNNTTHVWVTEGSHQFIFLQAYAQSRIVLTCKLLIAYPNVTQDSK